MGQSAPSGEVCVSAFHATSGPCSSISGFNTFNTSPPTSGMAVCKSAGCGIPSCYVITNNYHSGSCLRPETTDLNASRIQIPYSGMTICSNSPIPSGYTTGNSFQSYNCSSEVTTAHNAFYLNCSAPNINLRISKTGSGRVSSSPTGIDCGPTCTKNFCCTKVTLTATPDSGYSFLGWSGGGCSGTGRTCDVLLNTNTTVTAAFTVPYNLTIQKSGAGSGTVTSSPYGINCGSNCIAPFASGATVTLYAAPAACNVFSGWSGVSCSGGINTNPTCSFPMNANKTIIATFTPMYNLSIQKSGTGSGTVSSPSGINCGTICTKCFPNGTPVTLTATPTLANYFSGWSGVSCSGGINTNPTCSFPMNANTNVAATFAAPASAPLAPGVSPPVNLRPKLTIQKSGTGSGTVTGAGIDCGPTCSATYMRGTSVTLTEKPLVGHSFSGWSGVSCSGGINTNPTCSFPINAETTVTAIFTRPKAIPLP